METVTIVGGGLAGLTLGIGLRQRGVPVTVWGNGKRIPRHRVCGEFITGGAELRFRTTLGLLEGLQKAEYVVPRGTPRSLPRKGMVVARPLPEAALCVSRFFFCLDEMARP